MVQHFKIQNRCVLQSIASTETRLSSSCHHISVWHQTAFTTGGATGSWAAAAPAVILWAHPSGWGSIRRPRPRGITVLGPGSWSSSISRGAITATTTWSRPVGRITFMLFCRATAASWARAAMSSSAVTASHWTAWPAPASVSPCVPVIMDDNVDWPRQKCTKSWNVVWLQQRVCDLFSKSCLICIEGLSMHNNNIYQRLKMHISARIQDNKSNSSCSEC